MTWVGPGWTSARGRRGEGRLAWLRHAGRRDRLEGDGGRLLRGLRGLSAPLPLPWPIWPGKGGEVDREDAALARARLDANQARREVESRLRVATEQLRAREAELALFTPELVAGARADLSHIAEALQAGNLSVRDALLSQRSLLELLEAERNARVETVNARVELIRAAALPFPGAP